jgi:hypothetical protein
MGNILVAALGTQWPPAPSPPIEQQRNIKTLKQDQNVYCGTIHASQLFPNQLFENLFFAFFFSLLHNSPEILSWSQRSFRVELPLIPTKRN